MSGTMDSFMSGMPEKQWIHQNLYSKAHRTLCTEEMQPTLGMQT
jgi:hypothetical protein